MSTLQNVSYNDLIDACRQSGIASDLAGEILYLTQKIHEGMLGDSRYVGVVPIFNWKNTTTDIDRPDYSFMMWYEGWGMCAVGGPMRQKVMQIAGAPINFSSDDIDTSHFAYNFHSSTYWGDLVIESFLPWVGRQTQIKQVQEYASGRIVSELGKPAFYDNLRHALHCRLVWECEWPVIVRPEAYDYVAQTSNPVHKTITLRRFRYWKDFFLKLSKAELVY